MNNMAVNKLLLHLDDSKKQEIYITLQKPIAQHQIEGIRFLYRHYEKKKLGVILNDPSGYGKCLQVVLFIKAIKPLLDNKPIFIMCEQNSIDNWKKHFQEWTNFSDELAAGVQTWSTNKNIYINTVKDARVFSRRSWGIVIVHDSTFSKSVLRTTLSADFKIWVTSVDMKENLRTFSSIYEWLYPNNKFNLESFVAKTNKLKDMISTSIMLDAFLEDVVIKRSNFATPFEKPEIIQPASESPAKSVKNKDLTGTKVKRSRKRKIEDDPERADNDTNNHAEGNNFNISQHKQSLNVEDFIRDQKPIESDGFKYQDDYGSAKEPVEDTESYSFEFQNAIYEIVRSENSKENGKASGNNIHGESRKQVAMDIAKDGIRSENIDCNPEPTSDVLRLVNIDENSTRDESGTQVAIDIAKDSIRSENINCGPEPTSDVLQLETNIDKISTHDESRAQFTTKITEDAVIRFENINCITNSTNNIVKSEKTSADFPVNKETNKETGNGKEDVNDNNETVESIDKVNKNNGSVQDKLLDLERETLKKFKGSILDSLF